MASERGGGVGGVRVTRTAEGAGPAVPPSRFSLPYPRALALSPRPPCARPP